MTEVSNTAGTTPDRLPGLDGVRGLAALFVVVHHCWLEAYPGFPDTDGAWWNAWMAFGHLAVVVFIVLSGYSLALGPARRGWRLGGIGRFLRRRAWRILPPYWAALMFSLLVAWFLVPQPGEGIPTVKSVVVYGLLLHDVVGAPTPNGAFWSIAIEAQLYLVLPLLLLIRRRWGAAAVLLVVGAPAVVVSVLGQRVAVIGLFERFVPQMAVLFTLGVVAAGWATGNARHTAPRRWGLLAAVAAIPPFVLIAVAGIAWTVERYFWVDLLVGPSIAALLIALSQGSPSVLVRILDTVALRRLGSFSYSLYLVHAPIVVVLAYLLIDGRVPLGVPALLVLLAVAVPASIAFAWAFGNVFEIPFQRHRSRQELMAAVRVRLTRTTASPPQPTPTPSAPR